VKTAGLLRLIAALPAAVLCACAVGPDFKTPAAPATDRYTASPLPPTAAAPGPGGNAQRFEAGKAVPTRWWTLFGSDALDRLVDEAFAGSPTVSAAQATLRESQEEAAANGARIYPQLDGSLSAERQKQTGVQYGGMPNIYNLYGATISLSYGIDVFGELRRVNEAQQAAVDYQRFELQATYQTLAANVVTAAFAEASLRDQVGAETAVVRDLHEQLDIVQRQFALGGASWRDVLDARAALATGEAALPDLKKQLEQTRDRLAIYLGKLPADFGGSGLDLAALKLPADLPLGLPSDVVRQRPDVRAAEANLHQASANIGIATDNLLPQLTINGSFGDQASKPGDLFTSGIWGIGANLAQPIFHGGELRAKRREAVDAYDAAAAQYRSAVLHAFGEVADALRELESDADALAAQSRAAETSAEALHIAEQQYRIGAIDLPQLLDERRLAAQARIARLQALASRYADTAALFQALGGGALEPPRETVPAAPLSAHPSEPGGATAAHPASASNPESS